MKKYDSYKDSGIEWIGKIPKHWNTSKVKYIFNTQKGKIPKVLLDTAYDNSSPYLSMDYLRGEPKQTFFVSNEETVVFTNKNQTLLLWDGSNAGEFVKSKKGVLSSTMALVDSDDSINNSFQWFFFKAYEPLLKDSCNGMGIPHVDGKVFKSSIFLQPPIEEQTQIANYLDHKTAQIDTLINNKEKLITLLKEERTAVINQAVTKGLDPNVSMKDSGIEWLGEIPVHWRLPKMKFLCEFILDGTHGTHPRVENGFRLLSVRNIINGKFVLRNDDSRISEDEFSKITSRFIIQENDIQLAIVGATLGKVALVPKLNEEFATQRSLATIRTESEKCLSKFLHYFMLSDSFQSYLWSNTGFSAQPGIYLGSLQSCPISIPNIEEQQQIIEKLDNETVKIDLTIQQLKTEIKFIHEYRTALISEVVTGKIDVRDEKY